MRRLLVNRAALLVGLVAAVGAALAAVALAASSPTVVTGTAINVTDTTAVLTGSVDPNGRATDYTFSYGPTTAYGSATAARGAGSSSSLVGVSQAISGLTPGTLYHYRISALSSAGSSTGADRSFTTTGVQPAAVVTGAAVGVGQSAASPTGAVDPEGAATSWVIQYGLTPAYGYQTFAQQLPAVSQSIPIVGQLVGLAPATLFHYRIVAYHGTTESDGADQSFFTEPATRPTPSLRARTTPASVTRPPYTFTTAGAISGPAQFPVALRCTGTVGIRYYNGSRQVASVATPVNGSCAFSVPVTVTRLRGPAPARLTVRVWFRGNGYLAHATRYGSVVAG